MSTGVDERARVWESVNPSVVKQGGRALVLFASHTSTQGQGTAKDTSTVSLRAVDADSGEEAWTVALPRPKAMRFGDDTSPAVVGVEGDMAVVTARTTPDFDDAYDDPRSAVTYGVDLRTHRVTWQESAFGARMLTDGVIAGEQLPEYAEVGTENWTAREGGMRLVGRSVSDGTVRWKDSRNLFGLKIESMGAGLMSVDMVLEFKENHGTYALLDGATGKRPSGMTKDSVGDFAYTGRSCVYDQRSVVVCGSADHSLAALDTRTHKLLWRITEDDPSREVPSPTAAWHGAVYAGVAGRDGVLLDARTGKEDGTYSAGYLTLVNAYGALAQDLTVYKATG
ncbi:PQQ-binding-like beta-propeller repeat protein [Streptomyces sp. NPDC001743]|uniref:outer membrane protein assembly factor BamB family protein n=1 Tax=Streptomyces sp. NPDC001743 TaxID=3154397 RepID=UPI00332B1079